MTVECVLDTNVLLYAVSSLPIEQPKRLAARALLLLPFGTSAQIVQEFYVNATRKIKKPLPAADALAWVERLELQAFVPTSADLIKTAIAISERFQISYWDGAIVAAAEALAAPILYSEDLNHGQHYGPVRVVNPFAAAGLA